MAPTLALLVIALLLIPSCRYAATAGNEGDSIPLPPPARRSPLPTSFSQQISGGATGCGALGPGCLDGPARVGLQGDNNSLRDSWLLPDSPSAVACAAAAMRHQEDVEAGKAAPFLLFPEVARCGWPLPAIVLQSGSTISHQLGRPARGKPWPVELASPAKASSRPIPRRSRSASFKPPLSNAAMHWRQRMRATRCRTRRRCTPRCRASGEQTPGS